MLSVRCAAKAANPLGYASFGLGRGDFHHKYITVTKYGLSGVVDPMRDDVFDIDRCPAATVSG